MTLEVNAFIRRFLLHTCAEQGRSILPPGFHKIRYYGLLATRNRTTQLAQARKALGLQPIHPPPKRSWQEMLLALTGTDPYSCPACETGRMHTIQTLSPSRAPPKFASPPSLPLPSSCNH